MLETVKQKFLSWIEANNARDAARLRQSAENLFSPDYVLHDPRFTSLALGPEGACQYATVVMEEYSQTYFKVEDIIAADGCMSLRLSSHMVVASTGANVDFSMLFFCRVQDEKIVEGWQMISGESVIKPRAASEAKRARKPRMSMRQDAAMMGGDGVALPRPANQMYLNDALARSNMETHGHDIQVVSTRHLVLGDTVVWEPPAVARDVWESGFRAVRHTAHTMATGGLLATITIIALALN